MQKKKRKRKKEKKRKKKFHSKIGYDDTHL